MAEQEQLTKEQINEYLTSCPEDDKGRKIVPDDFFDEYYKELPNGTKNASGTFRSYSGGKLGIFGGDPEKDRQIQKLGGEAVQAAARRRRTFKEEADILLAKIDEENGKTGLENITVAMYAKARDGDVKAYAALRDTVGEQPVSKQEIQADIMTDADRQVIANALKRLKGQGHDLDATK